MIIGNPGITLEDGSYDDFAIVIEPLVADFISLNLCLDMEMIPTHLASNRKSIFYAPFINRDIFKIQSETLFALTDKELMAALIKKSFSFIFRTEELIKLNLHPKLYTESEIKRYEDAAEEGIYEIQENRENLWEIESNEYTNRGWYTFIVNYEDQTKLIVIQQHDPNNLSEYKDDLRQYERFFHADKSIKKLKYFDEQYWSVRVKIIPTQHLLSLLDRALLYLKNSL